MKDIHIIRKNECDCPMCDGDCDEPWVDTYKFYKRGQFKEALYKNFEDSYHLVNREGLIRDSMNGKLYYSEDKAQLALEKILEA